MKLRYLYFALLIIASTKGQAQLTNLTPNQGVHAQTLQTTITGNAIFVQSSSPSGNLYQIRLKQGPTIIDLFDWNTFFGIFTTTVVDPNTVTAELAIPISSPVGVYDLEVTIGDVTNPWWNQTTYTLPAAFTITPPDGYVTGTLYNDLNKNGIKDGGEPGLSGRQVKLIPINYILNTDVNGNYSFPVQNGNYDVVLLPNNNDYMFLTSSNDTLPATVNNNNSSGNDFGLKNALVSITPVTGLKGIATLHQIVADEPIFQQTANPYGNVSQFYVYSSPGINVNYITSVTVINSYTIQALINVPVNTQVGSNINIRIYTNTTFTGYHFLRQQFNIADPPSYISGKVFFDVNQNKTYDTGEPGINGAKIDLTPDNSIAFTDGSGNFLFGSLGGVQTVTPANNVPGLVLFSDSASYTFNALGNITNKNFGYISSAPDYSILVKDLNLFARCNSQQYVSFRVRNVSNVTYNAVVWMKASPNMSYISALPALSSISNDTVYWNISNMAPYSELSFLALYSLPGAGSTVNITAGAYSLNSGGVPQLSQQQNKLFTIFCAWDPNDKQVTPEGVSSLNYTLMSDTLQYLIRFQNTGSDTAFKVVVLDTLDSDLDFNTFEVLGSSHSMMTELKSNGATKFTFNNILLPDSNVNEPGSHGYISYRIRPKTGLADATPVNNTAHIYFDFNPDVVTNTTLNTLVYVLSTGDDEIGNTNDKVLFYPNPFNQSATLIFDNPKSEIFKLTITSLTGQVVLPSQQTTANMLMIEKNKLSKGVYFYNLINTVTNKTYNGKIVVE